MIVAGCDVGSLTAKAVLFKQEEVISQAVIRVGTNPAETARQVMDRALRQIGLAEEALRHCVGTGYGKNLIPFANEVASEISCHARGACWQRPTVRTIIDIGGQDAKAIRVDQGGNVIRYAYNDKCASGTGRFLEIMAEALEIDLEEMGTVDGLAERTVSISNQCVIFAETEVVSLISDGHAVPDIVAGLHRAMAARVAALARGIGVEPEIVMTGGGAKNAGLFRALAAGLDSELTSLNGMDPQITGAVGAALIAAQSARKP
jgi:predicted CoA-substrate-specific enzyme activase